MRRLVRYVAGIQKASQEGPQGAAEPQLWLRASGSTGICLHAAAPPTGRLKSIRKGADCTACGRGTLLARPRFVHSNALQVHRCTATHDRIV